MKKLLLSFLCLMTVLYFGTAQAGVTNGNGAMQIDGLQSNGGPALPNDLGVFVNPGHLGDALIGGYYNARNAITQISIVNTSPNRGIAVKVRFREGKFSNEVLDFYLCLSAGDRWTAWVYGDDDPTHPAVVYPMDDDTPTYPAFDGGEPMKYGTTIAPCVTADMTKEGYFTVIAAQSWPDPNPGVTRAIATSDECAEQLMLDNVNAPDFDRIDPIGPVDTLTGTVTIWDYVQGAADYSYNMLALSNFRKDPITGLGLGSDDKPTLADSDTNNSYQPIDAVNYVLMKANMIAFYDIRSWMDGQSDVIITFPTKRQTLGTNNAQNPFQPNLGVPYSTCDWDADTHDFCEPVDLTLWDDAEHTCGPKTGFSPRGGHEKFSLCHEVNYIVVGKGAVPILNTNLQQNIYCSNDSGYPFDIGWIDFDFAGANAPANRVITFDATPSVSAHGLPAVGYELGSVIKGWWGHMLDLRYTSKITGPNPG